MDTRMLDRDPARAGPLKPAEALSMDSMILKGRATAAELARELRPWTEGDNQVIRLLLTRK